MDAEPLYLTRPGIAPLAPAAAPDPAPVVAGGRTIGHVPASVAPPRAATTPSGEVVLTVRHDPRRQAHVFEDTDGGRLELTDLGRFRVDGETLGLAELVRRVVAGRPGRNRVAVARTAPPPIPARDPAAVVAEVERRLGGALPIAVREMAWAAAAAGQTADDLEARIRRLRAARPDRPFTP